MGDRIEFQQERWIVPDRPIIPFIEGDGTGPDIWRAARRVFDAVVEKVSQGRRRVEWLEVLAGEKAFNATGSWLPEATLAAIRAHRVAIKGPLTTPVGGGIRSLNVALRQLLDLYACIRPVRYFEGVPSPMKQPGKLDVVIFRENIEDVYSGVEYQAGSDAADAVIQFLTERYGAKIRSGSAIGIKPMSKFGTQRLVAKAIQYAIQTRRRSVTLVHKGNIMKFTEGGFREWGYEVARQRFGDKTVPEAELGSDRKSTRLNSSHSQISYAVFCLKKKPDEPPGNRTALKNENVLNVRQSDVIDCFTRCTLLDPKSAESWHSLGIAHVPRTIFAAEHESVQKFFFETTINPPKYDPYPHAAFYK